MEKDRDKRYATAAEMKADLQHLKKETESGLTRTGARDSYPIARGQQDLPEFQQTSKLSFDGRDRLADHRAGGGWDLVF